MYKFDEFKSETGGAANSLAEGALLAYPHQRFLAHLIDISPIIIFLIAQHIAHAVESPVLATLLWCVTVAYVCIQLILLTESGQSIGKKILKIRIVKFGTKDNDGFITNVLLRLFVNGILNIIPFYYFMDSLMILRDGHRCLHDFIAGTQVIQGSISERDNFGELITKGNAEERL